MTNLMTVIRSHGHGPSEDVTEASDKNQASTSNEGGIFWNIRQNLQIHICRGVMRFMLVHYPPKGTTSHVNKDGHGTCNTFRIIAVHVNRALCSLPKTFADMWHGVFDLQPFCKRIGYNFDNYYSKLSKKEKKE